MSSQFYRKSMDLNELEDLLSFAEANPWPPFYPPKLKRRFLTELISSEELIFNYFLGSERVLSAVLLDKVTKPTNLAILEILALKRGNEAVLKMLLQDVLRQLPSFRSGIEVASNEGLTPDLLQHHGFEAFYTTYGMIRPEKFEGDPSFLHFERVKKESFDQYYEALVVAFMDNVDTGIPERQTMRNSFEIDPHPPFLLLEEGKVIGFTKYEIEKEGTGYIHTIGVVPEHRAKGIGRALLRKALYELTELGCRNYRLTVAALNEKALQLYISEGFKVVEKENCFRYSPI